MEEFLGVSGGIPGAIPENISGQTKEKSLGESVKKNSKGIPGGIPRES